MTVEEIEEILNYMDMDNVVYYMNEVEELGDELVNSLSRYGNLDQQRQNFPSAPEWRTWANFVDNLMWLIHQDKVNRYNTWFDQVPSLVDLNDAVVNFDETDRIKLQNVFDVVTRLLPEALDELEYFITELENSDLPVLF